MHTTSIASKTKNPIAKKNIHTLLEHLSSERGAGGPGVDVGEGVEVHCML
tara:strand:- start:1067 stop:1216 length:150 start_codon:yes stop_codon:yes gene_type:complete